MARPETIAGLSELGETIALIETGLDQLPSREAIAAADVIVVEVDPVRKSSIDRIGTIAASTSGTPIIAGVEALDIRTTRALLKHGVTDVLQIPFSIEDLLGALADVDSGPATKAPKEVALAPVVACIGCSGGVGTTTVATHLAGAWVHDGIAVNVIDLDLQHGDVGSILGLRPGLTLQDLVDADQRLDAELYNSVLARREGMPGVVASPIDILPIEELEFDQLQPILAAARRNCEMVVIDMPVSLTNWGLSTLFASQYIVLVGSLTVHSLRKMKRRLDFLVSMGIDRNAIKIVLNRVQTGLFRPIKTSEAEEVLRHSVFATIPDENSDLQDAQDQGELVWSLSKRGKFARAIEQFADDLLAAMDDGAE
ncbi:AAA family ATPase [Erythrobacter sp. JK5]|uniref:AAA family ATPase n=1 Tax=Erythrobacter sp. JK5 TaxID=2829500 RepID=UPI001BA96813|nr:AAA family ATPase [Erythrobacter sp. JK5]QUL38125.1 AAA family ATPase [Erythrobacter sp. JK5]